MVTGHLNHSAKIFFINEYLWTALDKDTTAVKRIKPFHLYIAYILLCFPCLVFNDQAFFQIKLKRVRGDHFKYIH